ncbi:hypothetical protein P389DRAFT_180032 [Cystobasidium minutum MCA 4210]|uniref:uncharacterized protein n=1 Tax=Cystobasidium minutum MCA 4210 TaxID=1397322 RepID=UPI0034CDB4B6|eukprot:jgi/Rhomi1/180032/fgenesh1_pg.4_\
MASMSYAGALKDKKGNTNADSTAAAADTSGNENGSSSASVDPKRKVTSKEWSARYQKAKADSPLPLPSSFEIDLSYPPHNFPPVIVSAWLDDPIQEHFSGLRSKYFPAHRNYIQGHITLFQTLPSESLDLILQTLQQECSATPPFEIFCEPYKLTPNAVVYIPLKADKLISIRGNLRGSFKKNFDMTHQDVNPHYKPHATIVNKVTKEEAARVFKEVKRLPRDEKLKHGRALGLDVWFYRGGPWEHIRRISFGNSGGSRDSSA